MTAARRLLVIIAIASAAASAITFVVSRAVYAEDPLAPTGETLTFDEDERELLGLLDRTKYIRARELAQTILSKRPRSFAATWALALVHHEEEGNFARALYYENRAEELLRARGLDPIWHAKILRARIATLSELSRTADELAELDRFARLYPPGMPASKIWPLIKQRRYAEAKQLAESFLTADDANDRAEGLNGLLAVESDQNHRDAAFELGRTAIERFPDRCYLTRNAGLVAWRRFRPELAEEWLRKSATTSSLDCGGSRSAFMDLAAFYLASGRLNEAVEAFKQSNRTEVARKDRAYQAAIRRAMLADVSYVLGRVEDAERLAREVYEQPERISHTVDTDVSARLVRTMRYWSALDTRANLEAERASYRGVGHAAATRMRIVLARFEARRAVFHLATKEDALVLLVRPNLDGTWTSGALAEILGPGVLKTAVAKARVLDAEYPEAEPYFDALSGEIAFRTGDLETALVYADRAVAGIPSADNLRRWYVMAWQASARWRQGDRAGALATYHEVLQKLPSALRILDLAVPVEVTNDGSSRAREVGEAVAESPRFTSAKGAFRIDVRVADKSVTICLTDASGFQFACATSDGDTATAVDAFHHAAFSPKISMTQADLSSLDGSTASRTADEVLEGLLK